MKCKQCGEPLNESEVLDGRIYCTICEPELKDLTITPSVISSVVDLIRQLRNTGLSDSDIITLVARRAKIGRTQVRAVIGAFRALSMQIELISVGKVGT